MLPIWYEPGCGIRLPDPCSRDIHRSHWRRITHCPLARDRHCHLHTVVGRDNDRAAVLPAPGN